MDDERLIRRESAIIHQQLRRQINSSKRRAQILSQEAAQHMQAREHQTQGQRQQVLEQDANFRQFQMIRTSMLLKFLSS